MQQRSRRLKERWLLDTGAPITPPESSAAGNGDASTPAEDAEEDEDGETCGFCIFMKAGGCKEAFNVRQKCYLVAYHVLLDPAVFDKKPEVGELRAQAWSACVDKERQSGGDFTEECREKVCCRHI